MSEARFELRIYRDRMILADGRTGNQCDRKSPEPFSSARLLVANTNAAGDLLRAMTKEVLASSRWLHWPSVTILPMELCDGELSMVELAGLRRMGEEAVFRKIFVQEAGHPPYALR